MSREFVGTSRTPAGVQKFVPKKKFVFFFWPLNRSAERRECRKCSEECFLWVHATQYSKKGSEKVLGRVLGEGFSKDSEKGACYGFTL